MLPLILFTALGIALFAMVLIGLVWAVRTGQLDDLDTPALRMLGDEARSDETARPSRTNAPETRKDHHD